MPAFWFPCEKKSPSTRHSENTKVSYRASLTGRSDGNDWNSASESSKRKLAGNLSRMVREKGISDCSANFYYDALNEAYDTQDATLLRQSIADVAGICTGMAEGLPAHQRNY